MGEKLSKIRGDDSESVDLDLALTDANAGFIVIGNGLIDVGL